MSLATSVSMEQILEAQKKRNNYIVNEIRNGKTKFDLPPLYEKYELLDGIEYMINNYPGKLFTPNQGICTCIDDGTTGDINLPGAGISEARSVNGLMKTKALLGLKDILHSHGVEMFWFKNPKFLLSKDGRLRIWSKFVRTGLMREIHSHDSCGAARNDLEKIISIFAKDAVKEKEIIAKITPEMVDEHAKNFAHAVAKHFGIRHKHIPVDELDRPSNFHPAEIVYVDFRNDLKKSFRPKGLLPQGYILQAASTKYIKALKRIQLALKVAESPSGTIGLGLVNKKNPMGIVMLHEHNYTGDLEFSEAALKGLLTPEQKEKVIFKNIRIGGE